MRSREGDDTRVNPFRNYTISMYNIWMEMVTKTAEETVAKEKNNTEKIFPKTNPYTIKQSDGSEIQATALYNDTDLESDFEDQVELEIHSNFSIQTTFFGTPREFLSSGKCETMH